MLQYEWAYSEGFNLREGQRDSPDLTKGWKSHLNCKTNLRYTQNETALYYRHVTAFSFDLRVQPNRCFDYFTGQLNILRATRAVTVWIIYLVFHVFSAISAPEIDDPLAPKKDLAQRYVFFVFLWHVIYSLYSSCGMGFWHLVSTSLSFPFFRYLHWVNCHRFYN